MAVALTTAVVAAGPPRAAGASVLPAGFVLRDTATGQGQYNLTDFGYLPDGSVLTTGKNGLVTWVPQSGSPRRIAQLDTDTSGDLGLVGVAVAPDYQKTQHVYLIRSLTDSAATYPIRLSRFTVTGGTTPTGLTDETPLLEVTSTAPMHGMTTVIAAPDGTLWVSVGDTQTASKMVPESLRALDPGQPFGKLLHLTADGAGVPSNPYYDRAQPASWRSRVYASGFRSPFRFSLNPSTGAPIVGDVGWNTWEEVDLAAPGQSYKWPCWEGPAATPGYSALAGCAHVPNTPPIWDYHHGTKSTQGNSVTGGIVYTGQSYPKQYRGAYFFGDYVRHKLWTMSVDGSGKLVTKPQDPPFGTDIGGPVRFAAAANGDIVYADIVSGVLRRLSYSPGNHAPVARATTTTDPDTRTVTFDGSGSTDVDGDTLGYRWDFGDGNSQQGIHVTHTYAGTGTSFQARLTVTDPSTASDTTDITVAPSNHSPTLAMTTPEQAAFAVGENVTATASATDAEDGALPVQWTSAVVHCPQAGTCHVHPGTEGADPTFALAYPDHPDSHLELTATAVDSAGVQVSRTYDALPRQHQLTLTSNVPAVLDMPAQAGGTTALVTEGAVVDVTAAKVAQDGVAGFAHWSNGSTKTTDTVTMGTQDLTLTATYQTPIDRRYLGDTAVQGLLGGPTAPEVAEGTVHYRTYQHGRMYWTKPTGVHEVHGSIGRKFVRFGGATALGVPLTDETSTRDGLTRYNDFAKNRSIYWTSQTGAHLVRGAIRTQWLRLGAEGGVLGYPVTDERKNTGGPGRHSDFVKGSGTIYWSRATGAHEIYGPIALRWAALGGNRSRLGLPVTGVTKVNGGLLSRFQHGSIRWYSSTGRTVVRLT